MSGSDAEPPAQPGESVAVPGRLARLRARADRAADHYQHLAQQSPLLGLPLVFITRYAARQGVLLASAFAFRMFLWLMPLALLLTGIFAGISGGDYHNLESASNAAGITGTARREVLTALQEGHHSWWVAVIIGAVAFLWTTRTLIRSLIIVNAHAWQAPPPKRSQRERLVDGLLFAVGGLLVLGAAALILRLDRVIPAGIILAAVVEGAIVAAAWLIFCLRLPDRRSSWTDLLPGSVLVGIGLAVMHAVSRVYIPHRLERTSRLYGTLGVSGVILIWLLVLGQLVVSGAIINSIWTECRAGRIPPPAANRQRHHRFRVRWIAPP